MRDTLGAFKGCAAAELAKLRSLRSVWWAAVATIVTGALVAAVSSYSARTASGAGTGSAAEVDAVAFAQVAMIVLATLPWAQESAGRHMATTLLAVPRRGVLLAGKATAAGTAITVTAALTVWASAFAAGLAGPHGGSLVRMPGPDVVSSIGAVLYLTLVGMIAHGIATWLRGIVPSLVMSLSLVVVLPPLVSGAGAPARLLPSIAGRSLYAVGAQVDGTSPPTGALVMAGWVLALGILGGVRCVRRDG